MKKILTGAWLAGTLALPSMAQARPVVLTTQLQNYNGSGAYLAFYIVGADRKLTHRGCGPFLGLVYIVKPKLSRYSIGLR